MVKTYNIRKQTFFALDTLRGGRIKSHLRDLDALKNAERGQQDVLVGLRLYELLRHAKQSTDFYSEYEETHELARYPVVNKRQLQRDTERFLSRSFRSKKLVAQHTSGSYGTPMRVLFSADKWARRNAEVIFYNRRAGLDVGDVYLHVSTDKKSAFHRWRKNTIVLDATRLDATWLEETVTVLQQNPGRVIVGFASALLALAEYGRDLAPAGSIRLGGAVSAAEPLPENARAIIAEVFGCTVFNRYASTETGVLAFTDAMDEELKVNRSSYVIEVLAHDADRPVRTGEQGRVVVTDLFSHALPLIRYDIGDLAVAGPPCEYGVESLSRVEGRVVEVIYDASGIRISWATIYDIFSDAPRVFQYQFCQVGEADYRVMMIKRDGFQPEDETVVRQRLVALLGDSATLSFEYVQSIPVLASGKRPAITSEWKREESTANHD